MIPKEKNKMQLCNVFNTLSLGDNLYFVVSDPLRLRRNDNFFSADPITLDNNLTYSKGITCQNVFGCNKA